MLLAALVGVAVAPSAAAAPVDQALNGIYQVVSNGDWAKTDDVRRNQTTVVSHWTIESTCTDPYTCTGTVTSDQGWSAPLVYQTSTWRVRRTIEDWQHCPDGTTSPGHQLFRFYPMDRSQVAPGSPILGGEDITTGVPGACGRGYPVEIRMPLRLVKQS